MGNTISRTRLAIREFLNILKEYNAISKRLEQSPGLPVADPTLPFWMVPPSPIAKHRSSADLPNRADVVIIGSGITGTSATRALLDDERGRALSIVMLEARDTCSGATGRNGGHISPPLYLDYPELKAAHGAADAQAILRFRLAHITELAAVARAEDLENDCQSRAVEACDVFYDENLWADAKEKLKVYRNDMSEEGSRINVYEGEEAVEKFQLAKHAVGCIATQAGAIHPYRLVTRILSRLLATYPQFRLYTGTPCTSISEPTRTTPFYTLSTPSGTITTPHIIHATNAYTSTLLVPMRTKIVPIRGNMSAQRPGTSLAREGPTPGSRSFVFYSQDLGRGFDYLTQLPVGEHEFMFGAAFAKGGLDEAGNTDDTSYNALIASHLSGALPLYFGAENWGKEKTPEDDDGPWSQGRVKALWSGILGISADGRPWVGRLSRKISGRVQPPVSSTPRGDATPQSPTSMTFLKEKATRGTAAPGEWLSAGYSGEGMPNAWLSGKAVALMLLGDEGPEWFPSTLRVTEKRWKKANITDLI